VVVEEDAEMSMDYYHTLIAVADDCPVAESVVPESHTGKKTVAVLQYELLAGSPHVYSQEDVLFEAWLRRQDIPEASEAEVAQLRKEFFAKPQPCLRASPLPKKYGWGFSFDERGTVALCPMESAEYQQLLADDTVKVHQALRSSRG